jgi:ABC-2 type transport system permease protein
MSQLRLLLAFLRKDFLNEVSYKTGFVYQVFSLVSSLLTLFFTARLFADHPPAFVAAYGSTSYFAFAVVGMALLDYMWVAFSGFSSRVRLMQYTGILEAMAAGPASLPLIVLFSSAYSFLWTLLRVVLYLAAAQLFLPGLFSHTAWPTVAVVGLATLAVFVAIGLLGGALTLVFKSSDPVTSLLGGIFFLFGGVLYPVEVLPGPLASAAAWLPMTLASTALRRGMLAGAGLGEVSLELVGLITYALALFPLGVLSLRLAANSLRREGSLSFY